MKSRIATRGQVVIPKPLRDRLGLKAGQQLDFTEENGRLVAVPVMQDDPVARVYGSWGSGKRRGGRGRRSTDAVIDALRGRADAR